MQSAVEEKLISKNNDSSDDTKCIESRSSVDLKDEKQKHDSWYVKTLNQMFVYLIGRNVPLIPHLPQSNCFLMTFAKAKSLASRFQESFWYC